MEQPSLSINGINVEIGNYDLEGITTEMIAKIARGQKIDPAALRDAKLLKALNRQSAEHFGISEGINTQDLSETGWSIIFPAELPTQSVNGLKEALKPLLDLRKAQASAQDETFYKEAIGPDFGLRNGESKNDFLKRYGKGPGSARADPDKFPYYALIVGSPEAIPFSFQAQLDVHYAVGRIYFDKLEDYYHYAQSVVQAETKRVSRGRKAAFWGTQHQSDRATQISYSQFIQPLADQARKGGSEWQVLIPRPEDATKSSLANLMGGRDTPALLVTAAHGAIFKPDDPRLYSHQGALICQDWRGPESRAPITDSMYFGADDIGSDADVFGMVAVCLSSYGASTPKTDGFYRQAFGTQKDSAPSSLFSQLPMRLLSHPRGGALGVFAYSDRYWGSSVLWEETNRQTEILGTFMNSVMSGQTIGSAMDIVSAYYAEVSTMLTDELDSTSPDNQDVLKIAGLWGASNDNRNSTFLGDPAVRLELEAQATAPDERQKLGDIVSASAGEISQNSFDLESDIQDAARKLVNADFGPGQNFSILNEITKPDPEKETFDTLGVSILAGFSNDAEGGRDRLGITPDVDAFSKVIASKSIEPPLCLGLFGDWGSGKSFFMNKMQDRISYLSRNAKNYEKAGNPTAYCSNVIQIKFNAWHYVDADLWASLISHIFDNIADFIAREERTVQQAKLFQELQSAKQLLNEAKETKTQAESELTNAQANLENLQRTREEKSIDLKQLRVDLFNTALQDNVEVKNALDQFSTKLGISSAVETAEDVQKIIQEYGSLRGRLQAILLAILNSPGLWWRIPLFLLVLLIIPTIPAAINYFIGLDSTQSFLGNIAATITQITAFAAGFTLWMKGFLSTATKVVNDLEKAKSKVDEIVKTSRAQLGKDEIKLLQDISRLKEKETAARQLMVETQQRVDRAQAEITALEEIRDGRKLAQYVRERITNADYRKRLGIISLIRRDLQSLSDLLTSLKQPGAAEADGIPRIDRIVLYIDDLDRCPEERVVEVLQAIHLLLAFKLFVVVVGVDSRWLLHSLEKAYPALSKDKLDGDGWMDEERLAWETTPQNYLEKIFQIPYNLHMMNKSGYEKLIVSIVHPDPKDQQTSGKIPSDGKKIGDAPDESKKGLQGPAGPNAPKIEPTQHLNEAVLFGIEEPVYEESYGGIFDDQTPELLVISDAEEDFLKQLYALVPTPRAAKRLVNIYRIMRAKLPVADLPAFLGDKDKELPGEFKPVLALLAILAGFQREAPYVFRQINSAGEQTQWKDILETIQPRRKTSTENEVYYNGFMPTISKAESTTWRRLYFALHESDKSGQIPADVKIYRKWAQQVAHFSFRLGKSFIYYGLPADIKIISINVGAKNQADECVVIENMGDSEQDMTGWRLLDQNNHEFIFPTFLLDPRCQVRIWSIAGKNNLTDLYWGRKEPIWNDKGDNAYLYDKSNALISNLHV